MAANVQIRLDPSQVKKVLSGPNGPVWQEVRLRGAKVLAAAQIYVPVGRTGNGGLKNSLTMEMGIVNGVPVARVGSNLDYALYVHEGTGLYSKKNKDYIRPKKAKVLRWPNINGSGAGNRRYKGGKTASYVYSKRSKGSPGRPFLTKALAAAGGKVTTFT